MLNFIKLLLNRPYLNIPKIEDRKVTSFLYSESNLFYIVKYKTKNTEHFKSYIKNNNKFLLHNTKNRPAHIELEKIDNIKYKITHNFFNFGKRHREGDKPAIYKFYSYNEEVKEDKIEEVYYKNGLIHREGDKPAIYKFISEFNDYTFFYYKNGLIHREGDKPAVFSKNDYMKKYYINGKLHRDNGLPAIETFNISAVNLDFLLTNLISLNFHQLEFAKNSFNKKNNYFIQKQKLLNSRLKKEYYINGILVNEEQAIINKKIEDF